MPVLSIVQPENVVTPLDGVAEQPVKLAPVVPLAMLSVIVLA